MENKKLRIAVSHGDINGISYEILFKTFDEPMLLDLCTPVIYGSSRVEAFWRKQMEYNPSDYERWHLINHAEEIREGKVNLVNCDTREWMVNPGKATPDSGEAALTALERATWDVKSGLCDALVTAPINKAAMPQERFPYRGHTDYLQHEAAGETGESLMILCSGRTRVALVTTHLAISEVTAQLNSNLILRKVQLFESALIRDFGIVKPQIAVLALNPHAGDNGLMGSEEKEIIRPAIEEAQSKYNIFAHGPFAADGFWGTDSSDHFDGILAMYHDQGLAPFKALYMDSGVNVTAGLNIVRTSPDHGTAYDIAGKNFASPDSMRRAVYAAIDIVRSRRNFQEANQNPLRKLYFNRGKDDEKLDLTAEENND